MPRHVHLCVHKEFLTTRTINNTKLKPWTPESLKIFLEPKWINEHGGNCLILKYDPSKVPSGVEYCLKKRSQVREVFTSKGLQRLLNPTEVVQWTPPHCHKRNTRIFSRYWIWCPRTLIGCWIKVFSWWTRILMMNKFIRHDETLKVSVRRFGRNKTVSVESVTTSNVEHGWTEIPNDS